MRKILQLPVEYFVSGSLARFQPQLLKFNAFAQGTDFTVGPHFNFMGPVNPASRV
jgi:hypothetical protein